MSKVITIRIQQIDFVCLFLLYFSVTGVEYMNLCKFVYPITKNIMTEVKKSCKVHRMPTLKEKSWMGCGCV